MRFELHCILWLGFYSSLASSYVINGQRWPRPETNFVFDLVNTRGQTTSPSGISWNQAFETAMQRWNERTVFRFHSQRGQADPCRDDGKNTVGFRRDDCGFAFGRTTLAITYSSYSRGTLLETDIVFNDNEPWDTYDGPLRFDATDFTRVATHELGHALGLGHEDQIPAIMSSSVDDLILPQKDDIEGVTALYGGQPPLPSACQVQRPLPLNAWVPGRLESADCRRLDIAESVFTSDDSAVDLYTLDLPVAGLIVIRLESDQLDPYLEIRQAGSLLASDDDSGSSTDALIVKHLPAGRYQVVAGSAFRTLQEGDYRLAAQINLGPPNVRLESDWSVTINAVEVGGVSYSAKLAFFVNPQDPHGLYWRLDSYALDPGKLAPGAILLETTDLVFNPVEALGSKFDVILKRYVFSQDPAGWYWKLDQVFERH
ncbi:MAG: M10 family metallopeptidase domain-containing protein [Methylohalobius sp.]|nr:M10 family metallopeptidase domain-containing protein [Methylohalobius sp.]